MRALVVEDNADTAALLAAALRRMGCEVVRAEDGAEALAAVALSMRADCFDLIIVDVAMRHVDGLAFFKALNCFKLNDLYPSSCRVKFHTAYEESRKLVKTGKVGAEDYYLKGADTERLLKDLEVFVCGRRQSAQS